MVAEDIYREGGVTSDMRGRWRQLERRALDRIVASRSHRVRVLAESGSSTSILGKAVTSRALERVDSQAGLISIVDRTCIPPSPPRPGHGPRPPAHPARAQGHHTIPPARR